MRGLVAVLALVAATGCSIVLKPNRDAIAASLDGGFDGGVDGGYDAGRDAGYDASTDAGTDAGCIPTENLEVSCSDGVDNDCDMQVDCADRNCASDGYCCDVTMGAVWQPLRSTPYSFWTTYGSASAPSDSRVEFGTSTGQVVFPTCTPLAFGMRFLTEFEIEMIGSATDYASVVFAPVDRPRGGADMTLLSDLAVRVTWDGNATLERAGTVIGSTETMLTFGTHAVEITLQPSVDESGRPVLLVTASVGGQMLGEDLQVLMPLSDLVGESFRCVPDGLFVAMEGRGAGVRISQALQATTGNCPNPTQFIADATGPLAEDPILASGMWRSGGAGEPALLASGTPTDTLDLLVDASDRERSDEILRFIDFSIGGAVRIGGGWFERLSGGAPELFGATPSSREPSLANGAALSPRLVAYARATTVPEVFEIAYADLAGPVLSRPGASSPLLSVDDTGIECDSLRDPSLVALEGRDNLLLFFTCERAGMAPRIGVARLHEDTVLGFVLEEVELDLFPASVVGAFGRQGVLSPEVVVTGSDAGTHALRIWFLARGAGGQVTVGFAFGEVEVGVLPRVILYPGNPVLGSEDQVLGGPCPLGCTIESLGVTATQGVSPLWSPPLEPSYLFVVERSRFRADGVDHQLVPVRQPRPSGG